MSLIPASSEEIVVGKAPAWPLYDQERNLLLEQGTGVRDEAHRAELLASNACYELAWQVPKGGDAGESSSPMAEAISASAPENDSRKHFSFDEMKLKPGDWLQLEPPPKLARERFSVKVIGFVQGVSMLVTLPVTQQGLKLQLIEHEKVVMRSFTGQNAFGFACYVQKVIRLPFEYMHLTFPEDIQGIMVRKAPRIKTHIIATVHDSKSGEGKQVSALISDISANGVSLESGQQLGEKGDVLNLAFRVQLHNVEAYLSVKGIIRAVINNDPADASSSGKIRHGIEFHELQPNDSVILQSMIYQQLIENPKKMI